MLQECANRNTHVHKGAQAPPNKTISLARRWELPNPDLISRPHLRDSSDKIILRCLFLCCCVLPPSYKAACPCQTRCVSHPAASLPCHSPVSRVFTGHDNFRRQLKETENPFIASPSRPCCAPRHLGVTGTDQGLSLLSGKSLRGRLGTSLCRGSDGVALKGLLLLNELQRASQLSN